MTWHKIDDPDHPPPKDGTRIMLGWARGFVGAGWYYPKGKIWQTDRAGVSSYPTHWQSLPSPPKD